ncbi:MAG: hypothetical protein NVV63_02285 [Opitutus sp.]|nr:hypothetical protein [Opitutus sp.]
MIATLTKPEVLAAMGARTGDSIPAAIAADYARTAMFALCDGPPVTTQKLCGSVEERLQPLVRFRSRTVETFFGGDEEEDESASVKSAVDDLVQIGDFVSVGNGYHYPAAPRLVRLDAQTCLIIGGAPSRHLGPQFDVDTSRPTLARLAVPSPSASLPQQDLASWLGAPTVELRQWTREQLQVPLERTNIAAEEWEVANLRDGPPWTKATLLPALRGIFICRELRENVNGSRKFIARLERKEGMLTAVASRPVSHVDCRRLLHGQKLILGINRRVVAVERGDFFAIRLHRYSLPEVLRLLKALCHDWTLSENGQLEFLISASLRYAVRGFLGRYAMHLPSLSP